MGEERLTLCGRAGNKGLPADNCFSTVTDFTSLFTMYQFKSS